LETIISSGDKNRFALEFVPNKRYNQERLVDGQLLIWIDGKPIGVESPGGADLDDELFHFARAARVKISELDRLLARLGPQLALREFRAQYLLSIDDPPAATNSELLTQEIVARMLTGSGWAWSDGSTAGFYFDDHNICVVGGRAGSPERSLEGTVSTINGQPFAGEMPSFTDECSFTLPAGEFFQVLSGWLDEIVRAFPTPPWNWRTTD